MHLDVKSEHTVGKLSIWLSHLLNFALVSWVLTIILCTIYLMLIHSPLSSSLPFSTTTSSSNYWFFSLSVQHLMVINLMHYSSRCEILVRIITVERTIRSALICSHSFHLPHNCYQWATQYMQMVLLNLIALSTKCLSCVGSPETHLIHGGRLYSRDTLMIRG